MDAMEELHTAVKKRDKEWPQYAKRRKQLHKQLKKAAKEFKDFDFGYMMHVIDPMIRMYFNLHSRPNVVVYDTSEDNKNDYESITSSLTRCQQLLSEYEQIGDWVDNRTEADILKELFTEIGEHITEWWE